MIYGYRMENGGLTVDENAACGVIALAEAYLDGDSIEKAGSRAGIDLSRDALARILRSTVYLGYSGYPAILSQELYRKIQEERLRRTHAGNRKAEPPLNVSRKFIFHGPVPNKDPETAAETAEYIYSLIARKRTGRSRKRAVRKWIEEERELWLSGLYRQEKRKPDGERSRNRL